VARAGLDRKHGAIGHDGGALGLVNDERRIKNDIERLPAASHKNPVESRGHELETTRDFIRDGSVVNDQGVAQGGTRPTLESPSEQRTARMVRGMLSGFATRVEPMGRLE
jgi:hypothetical protein